MSQGSSPRFSRFLADYGDIEAECIGVRYNRGEGKGLQIPMDYRLRGNSNYLEKLVTSLKKREPTYHLDISNIRKCQIQTCNKKWLCVFCTGLYKNELQDDTGMEHLNQDPFYGFLRVGEITCQTTRSGRSVLQHQDLSFLLRQGEVIAAKLPLTNFKHN